MKLTERDKKLLLMLAYFVVIVGFGAFVFRPMIGNYTELGDRIVLLEAEKQEMDERIAQWKGLEQRRNELADLFRISTEEFYPMLESEEVDKEITGIVLSCGMQALNLNIAMPQEGVSVTPYRYAEETAEMELSGDAPESVSEESVSPESILQEDGSAQEGEAAAQSYIYAPVVTLTAAGSEAQAEALIDKLMREYPAIRVRSYSHQMLENFAGGENVTGTELLSLELELYMCDHSVSGQGEKP